MKFNIKIVLILFFILGIYQATNAQEQKPQFFFGLTLCPSIPVGNFADNSDNNKNAEFGNFSYGISDMLLDFGFIFKNSRFGLSATYISEGYIVNRDVENSRLDFSNITLGPMYSFRISNRFTADLKCQFGYVSSLYRLSGTNDNSMYGKGFGIDLRSLMRYQLSKHWFLIGQCGYMYSNQSFKGIKNFHIQALNVGLGVGFKIG
ncbi:MAG TPA: hypothetical protein VK179_18140 [Bacteroidales bacterium]|nr:hypothetical protein [Bacteroidales bacterium]